MILQMKTERLLLRKMTLADAPALFRIWSDPAVTQFMNIESFTSEAQAAEMILLFKELHEENRAVRYSIMEKASESVIGSCGFNFVDYSNAKAEVAYDLDRCFWRQGFASEALTALVHHAFSNMNLHRLEAKVDPANISSIKLLEKLNFRLEGTMRQSERVNGRFYDLHMYALLKSD